MALIAINNRFLNGSLHNNNKYLYIGLLFIIYFVWMDIALYVNLQRWSPPPIETKTNILNTVTMTAQEGSNKVQSNTINLDKPEGTSVFKPLSVKLIMVDHISHYIHDILVRFIEDDLHFTQIFPWVTPNIVSFTGLGLAAIGCYLMISDKLLTRQIGSVLFELRNIADALDGVVFRSQLRRSVLEKQMADSVALASGAQVTEPTIMYQSNYGTFGYNVDIWCDGIAGIFFVVAILVRFTRNPPLKSTRHLASPCVPSSPQSGKIRNVQSKEEYIQMLNNDSQTTLSLDNKSSSRDYDENDSYYSKRRVFLIVASFGLRILFTALIWDYFVHKYHDAIMVFSNNPAQRKLQGQAFKSIGMWLIMWFWRIGSSCAMLEHLSIANFVDRLWEYLVFTSYIGWAYLIILTLFTQIHYTELMESLIAPF